MAAAGLNPHDDDKPSVRVPDERLVELDRLIEQGGIEAIILELAKAPPVRVFDTPEELMEYLESPSQMIGEQESVPGQ